MLSHRLPAIRHDADLAGVVAERSPLSEMPACFVTCLALSVILPMTTRGGGPSRLRPF